MKQNEISMTLLHLKGQKCYAVLANGTKGKERTQRKEGDVCHSHIICCRRERIPVETIANIDLHLQIYI